MPVEMGLPEGCQSVVVNGQKWDLKQPSPWDDLLVKSSREGNWLELGEGSWDVETE